jgi:hypothetical protein
MIAELSIHLVKTSGLASMSIAEDELKRGSRFVWLSYGYWTRSTRRRDTHSAASDPERDLSSLEDGDNSRTIQLPKDPAAATTGFCAAQV